jgi:hypothetical protein
MISEHTAIHTPTHRLTIRQPSAEFEHDVDRAGVRSTGWRMLPIALWRALTACCNPSFFELERPAPEHRRLGPGVSRVSDSFWPITEW